MSAEEWSNGGRKGTGEFAVIYIAAIQAILFTCVFATMQNRLQSVHSYSTVLSPGGPDSPPHCIPSGKNRDCATAAATHGPSRCCHNQRLHPPPHLRQGGAGGYSLCPFRGRRFTLTGHKGEETCLVLNFTTFYLK